MNGINSSALDRYITGNYGEDQYKHSCEHPDCGFYGIIYDPCPHCDQLFCPVHLEEHLAELNERFETTDTPEERSDDRS